MKLNSIKAGLIGLAILSAPVAFAKEQLNLPLFITPSGNFQVESTFNFVTGGYDLLDANGQRTDEKDVSQMNLSNNLRFGVGEGLDIGLNISYWLSDETETTPISTSGDTTTVNQTGLEEVSILARYRLPFDLPMSLVSNVDLYLTPSFSTSESGVANGEDGNKFFGGHRAGGKLSFGQAGQDLSYRVGLAVDYYGEQEIEPSTSSVVNQKFSSSMDFGLDLEAKFGASQTMYFGASAGYKMIGSRDFNNPTVTSEAQVEYGSRSLIDFGINIDVLPAENININFAAGYEMYGTQDITTISSGAISNQIDSENHVVISLGANLLF